MLHREHQLPGGPEHPVELRERAVPILHVVHGQRAHHEVEGCVFQPHERLLEVRTGDLRPAPEPLPSQIDHPPAGIEADHLGAPDHELFGVDTRSATGVEHPLAPDVPEQGQRRGTLVVGVVGLGRGAG